MITRLALACAEIRAQHGVKSAEWLAVSWEYRLIAAHLDSTYDGGLI